MSPRYKNTSECTVGRIDHTAPAVDKSFPTREVGVRDHEQPGASSLDVQRHGRSRVALDGRRVAIRTNACRTSVLEGTECLLGNIPTVLDDRLASRVESSDDNRAVLSMRSRLEKCECLVLSLDNVNSVHDPRA